jgi:uncharacterized membrane protein
MLPLIVFLIAIFLWWGWVAWKMRQKDSFPLIMWTFVFTFVLFFSGMILKIEKSNVTKQPIQIETINVEND